jgi:hypothetical protein
MLAALTLSQTDLRGDEAGNRHYSRQLPYRCEFSANFENALFITTFLKILWASFHETQEISCKIEPS